MLSRVADAIYWMSRYIERAENNARMLDVNLQVMLDYEIHTGVRAEGHWNPIISTLEDHKLFQKLYDSMSGDTVVDFVTFARKNPNSIYSCVAYARENARTVREQISSEMWEQINKLYLFLRSEDAQKLFRNSSFEFFNYIIEASHLFQGFTDATMTHGEGWDFAQAGRFIERADRTSRLLDMKYHVLLPSGEEVGGNVDTVQWMGVLRSCSALEAYRKIYVDQVAPWKVAEFLITDDLFPRSINFCVDRVDETLHKLSGAPRGRFRTEADRLSGHLHADLAFTTIKDIFAFGLHQYLDRIQLRLMQISNALTRQYCGWQTEELEEPETAEAA